MSLVPAGLLELGQPAGVDVRDGVLERAVARPVPVVLDGLVHLGPVVAEDTGGEDAAEREQVPTGVVVGDVRAVVVAEEAVADRVEDLQHHALEPVEVESGVAAHQFGRVGELVALDAGREEPVGAAADLLQRPRPGVEDVPGGVAVGPVAADPPAQGVLVGGVDVVVEGREVLGAVASPVDRGLGVGLPAALRVPVGRQPLPARQIRLGGGADLGLHPVEVRLGVQQPGVRERRAGGGRGTGRAAHRDGAGREPGRAGQLQQAAAARPLIAVVLSHWTCLPIIDASQQETSRSVSANTRCRSHRRTASRPDETPHSPAEGAPAAGRLGSSPGSGQRLPLRPGGLTSVTPLPAGPGVDTDDPARLRVAVALLHEPGSMPPALGPAFGGPEASCPHGSRSPSHPS